MHRIDLITGMLGSGKTTFIREYVKYLKSIGEHICILENDHGAINVDRVMFQDLLDDKCNIEMIIGGDTLETHRRRMRTKLISMAMSGYTRVVMEPSGVFDVDELSDLLYEEPLDRMYEPGSIIAIVDPFMDNLSDEIRYLICAQTACAGRIVFSRMDIADIKHAEDALTKINSCLAEYKCKRIIPPDECLFKPRDEYTDSDWDMLKSCGYQKYAHIKMPVMENNRFDTLFCYHLEISCDTLLKKIRHLFKDDSFGHIIRIKGYMNTPDRGWIEINATADTGNAKAVRPCDKSEDVLIIIGEGLNKDAVRTVLPIM